MIRKRINTDLFLRLSVIMKDGSPANFSDAENMKVVIWHSLYSNIKQEQSFTVEGNVINLQYSSEENQKTGRYGVSVFWSKQDPDSETGRRDYAVDFTEAFTIVPYSEQEDDGTIEYTGKVNQNSDGISGGGTVDLSDYYNKKEVDDKLKKKVDAESGKGLSSCDYTQEEKDKLAGLANYDDTELLKQVREKADKASVYTREEVDAKILSSVSLVTTDEQEVGVLRYGGKDYTIYELTAEISNLPTTAGQSVDVILSDNPLGNNLYLKVDCLSVSSGDGFPMSAFEIKKIYVDEHNNTAATIVCKEALTGEAKALLTIRYVKGLLSFDTFELSIPISELGITTVDEVTVKMPSLKYDKKFAFSWTTDDSILSIYSLMHKYINKKYIDDEYNFHDGMTPTTGMTPTRVLCSTDGCGNDVRFRLDSGWVSYNSNGSDGIHSDSYPYNYVRWSEMVTFLDFLNTAMNHGGGDQTKPLESIEMCGKRLNEKTGYFPFLLLVPGGTTGYQDTTLSLDYIYHYHDKNNLNYSVDSLTKESFVRKHDLFGRKTYDGMTFEQLCSYIDTQAVREDHPYTYFGGHVVADTGEQIKWTDAVKPFLDYLYDTYGKGGDDSLWFAGPEEIYEYLFTKTYSVITKSIIGDKLKIRVKVAKLPLFKKYEYSLILSKSGGLQSVPTVSINQDVVKSSIGLKSGDLLVNVNYNNKLIELAEKYTSKYEASGSYTDQDDGLYFAGMLNGTLAAPYLLRLNAEATAPVLNSISINSGAASTYERNVVVNLNVTGTITHYRIGETSDLSGVNWIAGTANAQNYILSTSVGNKNIYAQVKNAVGESDIKSSDIELQEKPATTYTVTGKSNNASYGSVTPTTQEVSGGETANLTAVANDGFIIESWIGTSTSTGAGEISGNATVANVQADQIVTCNFKATAPPEPDKTKIIMFPALSPTIVTLSNGEKASLIRGAFSTIQTSNDVVDTKGNVVGKKICDKTLLTEGILDLAMSNNTNPVLSGNTGLYPDEYINTLYGVYDKGVYPTSRGMVRIIDLAPGAYTVHILYSTQKALTAAQISGLTYEANGVKVNPPSGFNPVNNNDQLIDVENVVVGSDGILDIYMGNTQAWVRSGWNAIEIEKV